MAYGRVDCEALITGVVGLQGVEAAFTALGDPETHAKILIDPQIDTTTAYGDMPMDTTHSMAG